LLIALLTPPGGGQPTDHGWITPLTFPHSSAIHISNIQRYGLRCVITSPIPLSPGTKVRQEVDFARRWDHMQQHTGQHLLSAIMDLFGLSTLSWSMGTANEMNYIEIPRKPSDEEMRTIQERCNQSIRDNIAIAVETSEGTEGAKKLPSDYDKQKGVVRFIKIGDLGT
jgi:misacylated tRNA(Ala) deacylase